MKLIYIAYGNVSVFDSQVVALLNYYIKFNKVSEVILIIGIDYKSSLNKEKIKNLNNKIIIKTYKQYPQYLGIELLTVKSVLKALKEINNIEKYVIHIRNDVLAHYTYKALNKMGINTDKMIADVRGAGLEQLLEFSKKSKIVLKLKKVQRKQVGRSLNKINNISVVSKALKNYLIEKIGSNVNIKINSCLSNNNFKYSESERKILREKLEIKDSEYLLVLSTGGNNAWQNTEDTIQNLANKKYKILNLSRTKIQHDNVINKFVPYEEMYKFLCAADVAIIWREKGITNKVASPVKFSEYVCCGLPVLTNDSIDLISDYIVDNECGKILDSLDSIDDILLKALKKLERKSLSLLGQKDFGIDTISNQYLELYNSIV